MTRKILAALLLLTLVLGLCAATAEPYKVEEEYQTFDVTVAVPEGAQLAQDQHGGMICVEISFDESKPAFDLHISPSEDYEGKSLIDFTDEEKARLLEEEGESFYHPIHEFFTTPSGNMILLLKEDVEGIGFATMTTLYKGFYFSLYCSYADYRSLTDADIDLMHQITEGTDIIPAA